ncbi:MAG TPA: hypothetical protein VFW31_09775 [Candidatus Angelobacter sp.]|nr:hypothetical protein [Candidatus Angelobacter sp.]
MPSILYVGEDAGLVATRKLLLERAGNKVFSATNELEVIAACDRQIDVAILGEVPSLVVKKGLANLIRSRCPAVKVLELYASYQGKSLDDADAFLQTPVEPQILADCAGSLARQATVQRAQKIRGEAAAMRKRSAEIRQVITAAQERLYDSRRRKS